MFQTFQGYFKANNEKYFLKYDGERKNAFYTIMIIDKSNPDNTLISNTDNPIDVFDSFKTKKGISIYNDIFFDSFMKIKDKLNANSENKIIIIMTMEILENIEFYLRVDYKNKSYYFKESTLDNIDKIISMIKLI